MVNFLGGRREITESEKQVKLLNLYSLKPENSDKSSSEI